MRTNKYYIVRNGSLYHYGIKGQKWGKRNGPPYPLKEGEHSKAEEDAKKKFYLTDKQKKYAKIGLAILGASLTIYGGYKISQLSKYSKNVKTQNFTHYQKCLNLIIRFYTTKMEH